MSFQFDFGIWHFFFVRVICILRFKGVQLLDDDPVFVLFWTHGNPVSDEIGFRKAWDESVFGSTSPGRRCGRRTMLIQLTEKGMKTWGGMFVSKFDSSNVQTTCLSGFFWVLQVDSAESQSFQEPKGIGRDLVLVVCLEESSWGTCMTSVMHNFSSCYIGDPFFCSDMETLWSV